METTNRYEGPQHLTNQGRVFTFSSALVHGAWHGNRCLKRIRGAPQSRGHEELTLSLPGVADSSQLLSEQVDLGAHITVVANLSRYKELPDRLLCGHSCGGCGVQAES